MLLEKLLDSASFQALNICRTTLSDGREGWQASLQTSGNSFRIREGETPAKAVMALWVPVLPDCPVALPLCPVPSPPVALS